MENHMLRWLVWKLISPTAVLCLGYWTLYFATRLRFLIKAQSLTNEVLLKGWFFLMLEAICLIPYALSYIIRVIAFRMPSREKKYLHGDDVPTVDILICCCNEDIDIVLNTVRAACVQDYAPEKFRVFVCDDGASIEVRDAVVALPYSNVYYNARTKGAIPDYKAGNLNAGLEYAQSIPYESDLDKEYESSDESSASLTALSKGHAEYIAGLDADMIPQPDWLRRMMPYFLEDSKMGLACPPQTFYDVPTNDLLTQTMDAFAGITELFNDALGHADCMGSGYVVRTTAIQSIGGFPTESLSEDVCCSATLLGAGWRTVFVDEALQHGAVPESFHSHVKQRVRWFLGHIQTAMLFKLRFFGKRGKKLNFAQRIAGLTFDLSQTSQIPLILAYIAIPSTLIMDQPFVTWTDTEDLRTILRVATTYLMCHWAHQGIMGIVGSWSYRTYDLRMPSYSAELDQWLAPYVAISFVRTFILGKKAGFTASGSLNDSLQERNALERAPLHRRLYVTLITNRLLIHAIFVVATVAGVVATIIRSYFIAPETSNSQFIYLIERIGIPPLIWLQYVASAMAPILYVFFPPTTPNLDTLLVEDEKTGARYPTKEARTPKRTMANSWRFIRPTVSMAYTAFLISMIDKI